MDVTSYTTLVDPIRQRAVAAPDWPALVLIHDDATREVITARDVWADATTAAHGLRNAGLGSDDVVILVMGHSRQLIATFLGAMALGAIPAIAPTVTARVDLTVYRRRIAALVQSAAAAAVITHAGESAAVQDLLADSECRVIGSDTLYTNSRRAPFETPPEEGGSSGRAVGFLSPQSSLPAHAEEAPSLQGPSRSVPTCARPFASLSSDQNAFLQFTSGSGGVQKGVVHTHGGVLRFIEAKRRGHPVTSDDVMVNWVPLYHDLGLISGLLTPLVVGIRSVLMSPLHWVRLPATLLQAMHEFGGTQCYMPNFALNHCVRSVRERDSRELDLRRWTSLTLGGEPVRSTSLQAFTERFAAQGFRASALRAGYGMAEMVEGVCVTRGGKPPAVDWISVAALQREARAVPCAPSATGAAAFVSCGPPMPGAEVRVLSGDGTVLPERGVGEIEVRSDYMMRGYYRRPDLTQAALHDGWLRTGDIGYVVAGELYVVGRKSHLIIVGGRNIAPEEIEAVVDQVPGILPGRTVAFGMIDERLGTERVVLICESERVDDVEACSGLVRQVRRAAVQALDLTLSEVRMVKRGWIIKTSSGKHARTENRDKYLHELSATPEVPA